MKWISVKDRLPELNQPVLVFAPTEDENYLVDYIHSFLDGNPLWNWCVNVENNQQTVTHWMPLPEPPKE